MQMCRYSLEAISKENVYAGGATGSVLTYFSGEFQKLSRHQLREERGKSKGERYEEQGKGGKEGE